MSSFLLYFFVDITNIYFYFVFQSNLLCVISSPVFASRPANLRKVVCTTIPKEKKYIYKNTGVLSTEVV